VVDAIRHVLNGEMYLSSQMTNRFLQRVGGRGRLEEDPIGRLTDRELEIFEMIGKGMTTRQIARSLAISPNTVESHREKIKTKLELNNAAELAQRAVQWVLESG
jgi:DNA-binding NarL/FixJ family response regulator